MDIGYSEKRWINHRCCPCFLLGIWVKVLSVTLIKNVGQEILKKDNGLYPSVQRCPTGVYICRPELGSKIESRESGVVIVAMGVNQVHRKSKLRLEAGPRIEQFIYGCIIFCYRFLP